MTGIAVIQARTNSKRLPGKSLLCLRGYPLVILAAKRAANRGRRVIVATSSEASDDALAATVREYGLECYRGSLADPLSRIVNALDGQPDATPVFRLTADNVFPDGVLLDEMESHFLAAGLDYLCCNGVPSGLPYGLSAELTFLRHLREAERHASASEDREHVTPYVIRKFGNTHFTKHADQRLGHYRCTVDNLTDFQTASRAFEDVEDPIKVGFLELAARLVGQPLQPVVPAPASRLTLGTAQLGLSYGIANRHQKPQKDDAIRLVRTAVANGIRAIDTARAYGDSEEVIGDALDDGWSARVFVVTKLGPLEHCPDGAASATVSAFVDASVFRSLAALKTQRIDVLLLHRADHLTRWDGAVWDRLCQLRDDGRIGELGVSVQSPAEFRGALDNDDVQHIQMPFNLLDWRWDDLATDIERAKADHRLEIQVRSVFLQGLLGSRDPGHWGVANISDPNPIWRWLDDLQSRFGRSSIADLAFGYAKAIDWIDGIVIGMDAEDQLLENLALYQRSALTTEQVGQIRQTRPVLQETTLDPSQWSTV